MAWVIETVMNVSVLNVLLNTVVFLLSWIAGLLAARSVRNLLLLHLQKHGTAPILCDSESKLQRLTEFASSLRYVQSPTKVLIIVLSSVLFLIFEVGAESGVDSSNRCAPRRVRTMGICATAYNGDGSTAKNIASALYAQQVPWSASALLRTPIVQGMRKSFDGSEAFVPRAVNRSLPVIVNNCSSHSFSILPARAANIVLRDTRLIWNMRLTGVELRKKGGRARVVRGSGDFTSNPRYYDAFMVATPLGGHGGGIEAHFFDYADSKQLFDSMHAMYTSGNIYAPMRVRTNAKLLRYTLSCEKIALSPRDFELAVQVYRSTQLESNVLVHPRVPVAVGNESVIVPRPLSGADIIKAVIALKATDRDECEGETHVFTTCGTYDVLCMLPVLCTLLVLAIILGTTSLLVVVQKAAMPIPTTAVSWSNYAWLEISRQQREQLSASVEGGEAASAEGVAISMRDTGVSPNAEFYVEPRENGTHRLTLRRRTE